MQYRRFGNTGTEISALGFGCMRFPLLEDGRVNEAEAISMVRRAIDRGVNYIDTAYPYHQGESEKLLGRALQDGYRERTYLATKCPIWLVEEEQDFERFLDEQLDRLQTDHIDFYLLHALDRQRLEKMRALHLADHMVRAREAGKIRHIGFSFHDEVQVFKEIIDETDQWEFCQIQYNYIDRYDQAGDEGIRYAAEKGLGIIVMEPLLGGRLASLSEHVARCFSPDKTPVEHALDFVWNQKEISFLLSGMSSPQQLEDNLVYADRSAAGMLGEEELAAYAKAKEIFDRTSMVDCTGCAYCMPCPFGLNIPELFRAYNRYGVYGESGVREAYEAQTVRSDQCRGCRKCEQICPQGIKVSEVMKKIAALMG